MLMAGRSIYNISCSTTCSNQQLLQIFRQLWKTRPKMEFMPISKTSNSCQFRYVEFLIYLPRSFSLYYYLPYLTKPNWQLELWSSTPNLAGAWQMELCWDCWKLNLVSFICGMNSTLRTDTLMLSTQFCLLISLIDSFH